MKIPMGAGVRGQAMKGFCTGKMHGECNPGKAIKRRLYPIKGRQETQSKAVQLQLLPQPPKESSNPKAIEKQQTDL